MSEDIQGRALAIVVEAIEKPEEQRLAFAQAACSGDEALLREVQSLLDSHARAGHFLTSPTAGPSSQTQAPRRPDSEGTGTQIGPYKLVQLIGEGGFGSVFLAEQEKPVRRKVALKIIKLGMDTKQVVARFEAERQALAIMDHPHIAKVLDAGATETGRPYFVMELVRGVPITEYCDTNNLLLSERLELFVQVCQAVQHAHTKGIIHRDIKPSNVMITMADGRPSPKVIDFGIAKAIDQRLTEKTVFTEFRQMIGTPQYMSPEQAEMAGIDIDTRSDVYGLGVLLYELLVGSTPFDPEELRSKAFGEMQRMIREVEPQRPSTRLSSRADTRPSIAAHRRIEPAKLGQVLKGELDWIVMRAMEKDRTRRYETANGLALDVQRYLDHEPVQARPPSTIYGIQKFVSKHRVGVLASTAVLMALVVGVTLATAGFVRARADRDIADKARIDAELQRKIAEDQKQLAVGSARRAVENAKRADDNARKAELRLADGFISQADALSLAKRFAEAHKLYIEAYDKFAELKQPVTVGEAGLWSSYAQTTFPLLSFTGHTHSVFSVAIAPDGRTALSGSFGPTLKLWDLASGTELRTFTGHTSQVTGIAIARDGRTALSASADRTLKLWDLASGKELRTFTGHTGAVFSVVIAPDGRTALSGGLDKTLKLWDLASGIELRTFTGHTHTVSSVAIAPDGRTALSGSWDKTLKLWDLASGKEIRTFTGHSREVMSVAMGPDGRTALSASSDKTLKLWDLASGRELRTFTGDTDAVYSLAIAPDGRTALSGSYDNTLKLWDLASGKELRTFTGSTNAVCSIAIAPDGRTALTGSYDHTLRLWDLAGGKEPRTFAGHTQPVWCLAIAPDGRTAVSGSVDHTLKLWDLATGKRLRTFNGHADRVNCVAIAPDGRTALSGSYDHTLRLWDLASGEELRTFTGHTEPVYCVAIAPDGRTALSGSVDRTLKLWDLASGKELRTFTGHTFIVSSVAIAPDGRTALSAGDSTLRLWDLASGKELRTFRGHSRTVSSVAFAPDGRTALSCSLDRTLALWDMASGKELRTLTGHTAYVEGVAFAPDGRTALSASADQTLKLWDLASGKELRSFSGHTGWVRSVAISPDGRTALSGGDDNTLKLWDFTRGTAQRTFEPQVAAAQARLQQSVNDPAALATLGEWYAFCGMDQWAVEFLGRARERGAAVAPLTLARCYWHLNRNAEARHEFQIALEQSKDPREQTYLSLCIQGIDTEPERKLQQEALAAAERLKAEVAVELATATNLAGQGHLKEAGDAFSKLIEQSPDEHWAWYYQGCLLAYQQDVEGYDKHCKAMLERFGGRDDPSIADRTAKTCLLIPGGGDPQQLLKLTDRPLANPGNDKALLTWFRLGKALALYRCGDYRGCMEWAELCKREQEADLPARTASADLLLAMASQRTGDIASAKAALDGAEQRIRRDLPDAGVGDLGRDGIENWLVCQTLRREAEGVVGVGQHATQPRSPAASRID